MKITQIILQPNNSEGNQIIEYAKCEGDFNILNEMFCRQQKALKREKQSFIYKVEGAPANYYAFSLKKDEYDFAFKNILYLNRTW